MTLTRVCIPKPLIKDLQQLLEEKDGIHYTLAQDSSNYIHHTIWLVNEEHDGELMLQLDKLGSLRVKRVQVVHQRVGVFDAVFQFIVQHLGDLGVKHLIIEAVSTLEMNKWCIKHGFSPSPSSLHDTLDDCYYGDWYYT